MERAALRMISSLETQEDISPKAMKEALDLGERLLKQRKQLAESRASEDGAGIDALQDLMDPARAVERFYKDPLFVDALKARGWLPPAPKPRPGQRAAETRMQAEERDRRRRQISGEPPPEEDDSGLRAMIGAAP